MNHPSNPLRPDTARQKKHILFCVSSMRGGGAERVVCLLLQLLSRDKYTFSLALLQMEGPYLPDIPEDVRLIDLRASRARFAPVKLWRLIRRERPAIVFSTLGYLNLVIALIIPFLPRGTIFVGRESIVPSSHNQQEPHPRLLNFLYRHVYSRFTHVITQSRDMADDLVKNFAFPGNKLTIIHNPLNLSAIAGQLAAAAEFSSGGTITLLGVGRLSRQKGYDLLLQALARLPRNIHLTILGEGEEEDALRRLAHELRIEERVTFSGFQNNVYHYMKAATLFVLPSRYEGFPNVVLEALACGTPVVSFRCPGGVNEIIQDGINGFTAPPEDADALADCIRTALNTAWDKDAIVDSALRRFSPDIIIPRYEACLDQLLLAADQTAVGSTGLPVGDEIPPLVPRP